MFVVSLFKWKHLGLQSTVFDGFKQYFLCLFACTPPAPCLLFWHGQWRFACETNQISLQNYRDVASGQIWLIPRSSCCFWDSAITLCTKVVASHTAPRSTLRQIQHPSAVECERCCKLNERSSNITMLCTLGSCSAFSPPLGLCWCLLRTSVQNLVIIQSTVTNLGKDASVWQAVFLIFLPVSFYSGSLLTLALTSQGET